MATFGTLGYSKPESFTVKFTANGHDSADSSSVGPLVPGAATAVTISQQPVGVGSVDDAITTHPIAHVVDQFGNNVADGVTVNASLVAGTGTLRNTSVTTSGGAGNATFTTLGYSKSGETFTMKFTANGNDSVPSSSVGPLVPGAAITLAINTQPANTNGTVDSALQQQPIINVVDQYSNNVANGVTVTAVLVSGNGTLRNVTADTAGGTGNATFSGLGYSKSGEAFTMKFTANSHNSATSNSVTALNPGAAASINLGASPSSLSVGSSSTLTATLYDQYSNTVTTDNTTYIMFAADGHSTWTPHQTRVTAGVGTMTLSNATGEVVNVSITSNPWITPPADVAVTFNALSAPLLSAISGTPDQYAATIHYTSDTAGKARVDYGKTSEYGLTTSYPAVNNMTAGANAISLGSLDCNTVYHYIVFAKNSAGTEASSTGDPTFTTTACPASAPTVTITAPLVGAAVSGSAVAITATNGADYQIDGGAWVAIANTWNTTGLVNGSHTIRARSSAPVGYSDIMTVVVNNGNTPAFTWTTPAPGTTLAYATTVDSTYTVTNFDTTTVQYSVNGGAWAAAGDAAKTGIAVQVGTNTLQLKAIKTVGDVATTGYSAIDTFVVSAATVTPTVALKAGDAAIVSAYSATEAAARFASGLRLDTINAASITVNGAPVAPAATITAADLAAATTLGAHSYNTIVTSSTGHTANLTVTYQVNADSVAPVTPTVSLDGDAVVSSYTATAANTRFTADLVFSVGSTLTATINGASATISSGKISVAKADAVTVGAHSYDVIVKSTTGHTATLNVAYQVNADTVTPTVTLNGEAINSAYSVSEASARFPSGLQFTVGNEFTVTVNGAAGSLSGHVLTAATSTEAIMLGAHSYNVVVTSSTGNQVSTSVTYQVNADSVTPVTPTISLDGVAIANTYVLADANTRFLSGLRFNVTNDFSATVNGTTVGSVAGVLTAATNAQAKALGAHSYDVIVTSSTGHQVTMNVTYQVNADSDTVAPPVPAITTTGGVTVDADVYTIAGTAAADTPSDSIRTIDVYNGATLAGTVILPIGQTNWSLVVLLNQGAGNTFTAKSTDAFGNISAASAGVTITEAAADNTPPAISSISLDKPAYRVTQDANITATVVEDNTAATVMINGSSGTESPDGTWTRTFAHGRASAGTYSFNVVATDSAGNLVTKTVQYDVTADDAAPAPTINVVTPTPGATISGSAYSVTFLTGGGATTAAQVAIDGNSTWIPATTNANPGTYTLDTIALSLSNGSHTLRVKDTPAGGTTGYSDYVTFLVSNVDAAAPPVPAITTSPATVDADTYTISGTAGADTPTDGTRTITVYRNTATTVVGTIILPSTQTAWSFVTTLVQNSTNTFTAKSTDAAGNVSAASASVTITEATAHTTPPVITNVDTTSITQTTVNINWTTDESSNTRVDYGLTSSYDHVATTASNVTSHTKGLTGLTASTLYHFKVTSQDTYGNSASSDDQVFTTAASTADVTPPVISNIQTGSITQTSATITWTTDENSSSQVEYGTTSGYGASTSVDATPVTSHPVPVSGLTAGITYHFRVKSVDGSSNPAASVDQTFTTSPVSDTTAPTVTGHTPDSGATDASIGTIPTITFSRALDSTIVNSDNIQLKLYDSGTRVSATVSLVEGGKLVTITPASSLGYLAHYYLTISGSVKDLASNVFATPWTDSNKLGHDFTTVAVGSPSVDEIVTQNTNATANNTYLNGWHYTFKITIPNMSETNLRVAFANWVNSSDATKTVLTNGNTRVLFNTVTGGGIGGIVGLTEDNIVNGIGTAVKSYAIGNVPGDQTPDAINLTGIDNSTSAAGRQIQFDAFTRIPIATVPGYYTTTYGIETLVAP
ncbi:hypothetical protein D4S03_03265 [bacterium]|nr:MAG: hypothetical protein D4S03_03265 [bacterium]